MALSTRQRRPQPSDSASLSSPSYTKHDKWGRSNGGVAADRGLGWTLPLFSLGMLRYMSATSKNIIHDCDEVFNYWEPLHNLLYKFGFHTWEYSLRITARGEISAPSQPSPPKSNLLSLHLSHATSERPSISVPPHQVGLCIRHRTPKPRSARKIAEKLLLNNVENILLKEGTDTSQGKVQLVSNINACMVVADVVRTTLWPRGMDKLIHDEKGNTTIPNDGATIMKLLDIIHPTDSHISGLKLGDF